MYEDGADSNHIVYLNYKTFRVKLKWKSSVLGRPATHMGNTKAIKKNEKNEYTAAYQIKIFPLKYIIKETNKQIPNF